MEMYRVLSDKLGTDTGPFEVNDILDFIKKSNSEHPESDPIDPVVSDGIIWDLNKDEGDSDWLIAEWVGSS